MWVWLAVSCALFAGSSDALSKKLLSRSDERIVGWGKLLFVIPWLLGLALTVHWPPLSWKFWAVVFLLLPLELTAYLCYLRAIRISPISLTVPFMALTPLLTVVTGWIILGERVSGWGLLGVLAVTAGAYALQSELAAQNLWEPFRAMFRVPGIRLTLLAASIYSVTSVLGKKAIQLSSPAVCPFIYVSLETLALTSLARRAAAASGGLAASLRAQMALYLLSSLLSAGTIFAYSFGILSAPVAYFVAIKRLSLLVSVLYGGLLFRESHFRQRVAATGLMLAGTVLITLAP